MPEIPDSELDALLAGDLLTKEATAGLQPVAGLLTALTAAPEGGELAGHARALAQFRRRETLPVHSHRRRRPRLLTSLLSAKAAAAAAAAAAALGGLATAAYAGALPAPAQQFAHKTIGAPSPAPSHSPAAPQGTPSGPDATGPAAFGLCTAYTHAEVHGTATQKAVAFRNLAAAAGGAANITAYCASVPHPGSSHANTPHPAQASHGQGKATSHPAGRTSPAPVSHPTGEPSSHPTGEPSSHPTGKPTTVPSHH